MGGVEALIAINIGQGSEHGGAGAAGDTAHVAFGHATEAQHAGLHEVFIGHVVHPSCGEDHVGAGVEHELNTFFQNV
jgi:hypothetical protein